MTSSFTTDSTNLKTWRREWSVITAPKKKMSRSRSQGPGLFRSLDRWEKANRLNQGVGVCVVCASQLFSQLWKWSPMQGFFPPTVKMRWKKNTKSSLVDDVWRINSFIKNFFNKTSFWRIEMWYVPLRVQHEKIANRKRGEDRRREKT